MANTMQDFFKVEEEAYFQALSKKLGSEVVNQDAISAKIKDLEQVNNTARTDAERVQALKKLHELKKLNDDYLEFLSKKKEAVKSDSMPNFTFYPGDRSEVDHIEIRLPDGSKQRWPQASGSGISAVLQDKFTVAMPLNSTLIVHSTNGGVLELSPGNRVSAPFTGTNMDIENFCQQTYDNWIKAGKKQPINLNFSSIPPVAQNEIKKRVAQRLIDIHADSVKFASLDTRQAACNEMVSAITTVSEANQQPAFPNREYLKQLGVSEWGTTWALKRAPTNVVAVQREADQRNEALKNRHAFNQTANGESKKAENNVQSSKHSAPPPEPVRGAGPK